jgi:hypothetical protein
VKASNLLRTGPARVALGVFVVLLAIQLIALPARVPRDSLDPFVFVMIAAFLATIAYGATWVLRAVVNQVAKGPEARPTPPADSVDGWLG